MEQLIQLLASLLAALLIMLLHELPKTMVYSLSSEKRLPLSKVFYFPQYIDPIGLIFCMLSLAGFSKPYRYEIKFKKNAAYIGLIGLLSLLLCTILAYILYRYLYTGLSMNQVLSGMNMARRFDYYFISYFLLTSLGMLIVNLFPISSFDMGLIIAGKSVPSFLQMIRMDALFKLVLFIVLFMQVIPMAGIKIINLLLAL